MKKTLIYILTSLAMLAAAMAQDAQPAAQAPAKVPKTKGAYLIVALQPAPLTIPYSSAQTCEDERARIKELGLTSYCIWVQ